MSYHVAHYMMNRPAWRQAHLLTKFGVLLWLSAAIAHQYVIRTTPEEEWKKPARVAWRVHLVDAQIAALALIYVGVWLRWQRSEASKA